VNNITIQGTGSRRDRVQCMVIGLQGVTQHNLLSTTTFGTIQVLRFDRVPVFCMSLACVFVWLVLCDDGRHRIWEDPENRDSIPIYLRVGGPHRYITRTATHDGRPCGLIGMVIFKLGLLVFSCSRAVCTLCYRC